MLNFLRVVHCEQPQNITRSMQTEKKKEKKKEFLHRCISKILLIDSEKLSCFSRILLIDSESPTLKMDFFEVVFRKILLIDFKNWIV